MGKSINIVSKITPDAARRLDRIRELYGFASNYEILQYLLSAFLRHADPGGEKEDDCAGLEVAKIFENYENAYLRATISAPKVGNMLSLSSFVGIYRVGGAGSKRKSVRLYRIDGGEVKSSMNEDEAVLSVLRALRPSLEKELRAVRRQRGEASVLDTLCAMLRGDDPVSEEVQDLMGAAADAQVPQYGKRTKKVKSKSVSNG